MKKFLKILKWTGISIVVLLLLLSATVALLQNRKFDAPYPQIAASTDSAVIARGKSLVMGPAHCVNCHGPKNAEELMKAGKEVPLHGGYKWDLPFGAIYARNITPDKETGIGRRSDKELARVLRYGVHADGRAVLDFMPFHDMSDEDLTAVISYLRAQKPVVNKVPEHQLNIMGRIVKAFLVKPVGPSGPVPQKVTRDTSIAYGRYLVMNVANCNGCHTQRGMTGEYLGPILAGGSTFKEPGKQDLTPPNISGDSASRLLGWKVEDFIKRIRMGKVFEHSHMPWTAYGNMSDEELTAIFHFLKSVRRGEKAPPVQMAKN